MEAPLFAVRFRAAGGTRSLAERAAGVVRGRAVKRQAAPTKAGAAGKGS